MSDLGLEKLAGQLSMQKRARSHWEMRRESRP